MTYTIKPTPQFRQDCRRARQKGLDLQPLYAVISALAAGEELPPENRDRPLSGDMHGYRECRVLPDRLLVYRIDGDVLLLHLIRTGTRAVMYRKGGHEEMQTWFKTLYRSPVKTAVTFLLLAVSAFLMIYNLADYALNKREYRRTAASYRIQVNIHLVSFS